MAVFRILLQPVSTLVLLAAATLIQAQTFVTTSPAATTYRLNDNATFQEGCLDPCLCPIGPEYAVRGTYALGLPFPGNVVDFREITAVNWTVYSDGDVIHTITGTGGYRITNFDTEPQHALDLDLSIDGEPTQHFFSDFVPVTSNDGTIDLPVSINGFYCYDIVIRVSASPVPPDEITPYRLTYGSSYQIACFDPCDCVSQQPRAMRGRFDLVPLIDYGTYAQFAIVNARFSPYRPSVVDPLLLLTGSGQYTLVQGFAGPAHSMTLDLVLNGDFPLYFDQELHNTDTLFPAIDIVVDTNDMVCTDTVLRIKASPLPHLSPALGR